MATVRVGYRETVPVAPYHSKGYALEIEIDVAESEQETWHEAAGVLRTECKRIVKSWYDADQQEVLDKFEEEAAATVNQEHTGDYAADPAEPESSPAEEKELENEAALGHVATMLMDSLNKTETKEDYDGVCAVIRDRSSELTDGEINHLRTLAMKINKERIQKF